MTDTTFFIPTKAAFEHAFEAGAFTEAQADDYMYMHSNVAPVPGTWLDHFKHRDTRKSTVVRRSRFICRADPYREDGQTEEIAEAPDQVGPFTYRCDNCGFTADVDDFDLAEDLLSRLEPGGIFTDRECPKCEEHALAYPVDTAKDIAEARAEFDRLEQCRDAAPQLLKALVNLLRQTADIGSPHPAWRAARAEAVAAYKAAGWRPGEDI